MSLLATMGIALSLAIPTHQASDTKCPHTYRAKEYKSYVGAVYKRPKISEQARDRLRRMEICLKTPEVTKKGKTFRRHVAKDREIRLRDPWGEAWRLVDPGLKARLARLRHCESTNDYRASNGSHWGAYQYDDATWRETGGSGRAWDAPPREQDVRTAKFWPSHQSRWACTA